jgi:long-chain acyl-CoA synthetase
MHRFYNFSFAASKAFSHLGFDNRERFFSYLPLSHIAERLLVEMGGIYSGGSIAFAESLDTFAKDLAEAKPTVFLGVPRIWVKFQEGILKKMPQKKLDRFLKIPILKGIVKKKIKTGLGLAEAHDIYTGAAPTPASLIEWFQKLDINIQEAYAMTENCCYSHVTTRDAIQVGSVGQPLPDCEVRLGDQEEIQIRHAALLQGYYKDSKQTEETLTKDGWLRTGDVGAIDGQGFLRITGRVKDKFKTSKGKYVEPSPIELHLQENQMLSQVCVVGTGIPNPIALTTLVEEAIKLPKDKVLSSLMATLQVVNPKLQKHEQVNTVVILHEEWTVENNLLTPTLKVKRQNIEKIHMPRYQEWYEKEGKVLFE